MTGELETALAETRRPVRRHDMGKAAPELYAALVAMLDTYDRHMNPTSTAIAKARDAIAKVRGRME